MPSRKPSSKKPPRVKSIKRAKNVLPLVPLYIPPVVKGGGTPSRNKGVMLTRVWGDSDNELEKFPTKGKKVKRMRNPWIPDDIITLLKFVCTYQAGKYLVELIKAWMDYRKAQKIEIKVGNNELKIEGNISDRALKKKIDRFRDLIKGTTYDEIKVTLPKGVKRNIPITKLAKDKKDKQQ